MARDPAHRLDALLIGAAPAVAIRAVVELGIPDRLAEGPQRVEALAAAHDLDPDALRRLLRALAAQGIFAVEGDLWRNTPMSALLRPGAAGSRAAAARYGAHPALLQAWLGLPETLRTGRPAFEAAHGAPFFDWLEAHPDAAFTDYMTERTAAVADAVVGALDLAGVTALLDVGGGAGALLQAILAANPGVRGAVLDRRAAVAACPVEAIAGDFFAPLPAGFDAALLKEILHDWGDADAARILARCRAALPAGGRLFLVEALADDPRAAWMDLVMMVVFGGRERSRAALEALLVEAGFALEGTQPLAGGLCLLTATAIDHPGGAPRRA
ncbi:MAG: methyltransferase [Alphaproteobacteria bacterium]|nr:methyltransferase [Alphaproteobacteria bacterium]